VVERDLLTPYGLRTLAPGATGYRSRYEGNPVSRDSAYHQGTVWPWLLGPYITAYLNALGRSPATLTRARSLLTALEGHLDGACLGQMSEVLDADTPHHPGGAPAQAWSVAEILRVLKTELDAP
jgi:glycogen debranching enzyme